MSQLVRILWGVVMFARAAAGGEHTVLPSQSATSPNPREPHDCILKVTHDPRYFDHPKLNKLLTTIDKLMGSVGENLSERNQFSQLNERFLTNIESESSSYGLALIGGPQEKPYHLAELLNLSFYLYRISLPDAPSSVRSMDKKKLAILRTLVEEKIATRFTGEPFLIQTNWPEFPQKKVLDWAKISVDPKATEALLKILFAESKIKLPSNASPLSLSIWESQTAAPEALSPFARFLQKALNQGDLAEDPQLKNLNFVQLMMFREHLLNLFELRSQEELNRTSGVTPLSRLARSGNPGETLGEAAQRELSRQENLLEERRRYCRFLAPGKDNPQILRATERFEQDSDYNDWYKMEMIRRLSDYMANRADLVHGLPISVRQHLSKMDTDALVRLDQVVWGTVDATDHRNALRMIQEIDPEKLKKPIKEAPDYFYPQTHLPFFSRKTKRDSDFFESLDSQLSRLKGLVWEGCGAFSRGPLLPRGTVRAWGQLPIKSESQLSRSAIFSQVLNYLSPGGDKFERECERQGMIFRSEAAKSKKLLLREEQIFKENPHKLIALYQLIGLHLNWKATPQEIARDIWDNFPDTKLAELKQFREDFSTEKERFDLITQEMSLLTQGPKPILSTPEELQKIRHLRERLRLVWNPLFARTLQTLSDTIHKDKKALDAIDVGLMGISVKPDHGSFHTLEVNPLAITDPGEQSQGWLGFLQNFLGKATSPIVSQGQNKDNASHARQWLELIPKAHESTPLPDKINTRQKLHSVFNSAYQAQHQRDLKQEFSGDLQSPPSAEELAAVRRLLESVVSRTQEGESRLLIQSIWDRLEDPKLKLFSTNSEKEMLHRLRDSVRKLPPETLDFHLSVLEATLLKYPKLLNALQITEQGINLVPEKMTEMGYLVIPEVSQGNLKALEPVIREYTSKNALLAKKMIENVMGGLRGPPNFATPDALITFFDSEYQSQYGHSLNRLKDDPASSKRPILSAILHLLQTDRLALEQGQYSLLNLDELYRLRKGSETSLLSRLRIPWMGEMGRALRGEVTQNSQSPKAQQSDPVQTLSSQLARSSRLFSRDPRHEPQIYQLVAQDLERIGNELKSHYTKHSVEKIPDSPDEQSAYSAREQDISQALAAFHDAKTAALQHGYGAGAHQQAGLCRSPLVKVEVPVNGGKVTINHVPLADVTDPIRSQDIFWRSVPDTSPACSTLSREKKIDDEFSEFCEGYFTSNHADAPGISRYPVSTWIDELRKLWKTDRAKFMMVVGHYRRKEQSILGQQSTDPYHEAIRKLVRELVPNISRGKIVWESFGENLEVTVFPGKLGELANHSDPKIKARFDAIKNEIPIEVFSKSWVIDKKPMTEEQALTQLELDLESYRKRVARLEEELDSAQELINQGKEKEAREKLAELNETAKGAGARDTAVLIRDLMSCMRYFPDSHPLRSALFRETLPAHLQALLNSSTKSSGGKTYGQEFSEILDEIPDSVIFSEHMAQDAGLVPYEIKNGKLSETDAKALFDRLKYRYQVHTAQRNPDDPDGQNPVKTETHHSRPMNTHHYGGVADHSRFIEAIIRDVLKKAQNQTDDEGIPQLLKLNLESLEEGVLRRDDETATQHQNRIHEVIDHARGFFLEQMCVLRRELNPPIGYRTGAPPLWKEIGELLPAKDPKGQQKLYRQLESVVKLLDEPLVASRPKADRQYPYSPELIDALCDSINEKRPETATPEAMANDSELRRRMVGFLHEDLHQWIRSGDDLFQKQKDSDFAHWTRGVFETESDWLYTPVFPSLGAKRRMNPRIRDFISTKEDSWVVAPEKLHEMRLAMESRLEELKDPSTRLGEFPTSKSPQSPNGNKTAYEFLIDLERGELLRSDKKAPSHVAHNQLQTFNSFLQQASSDFDLPFGGLSLGASGALTRLPKPIFDMLEHEASRALRPIPETGTKEEIQKHQAENTRRKAHVEEMARVMESPWPDDVVRLVMGNESSRVSYGKHLDEVMRERFDFLKNRKSAHDTIQKLNEKEKNGATLDAKEKAKKRYLENYFGETPLTLSEQNEYALLMFLTGCEAQVKEGAQEGAKVVRNQTPPLSNQEGKLFRQSPRFAGYVPSANPNFKRFCQTYDLKAAEGYTVTFNRNLPSFGEVFAAIPQMTLEEKEKVRSWATKLLVNLFALEGKEFVDEKAVLKAAVERLEVGIGFGRDGKNVMPHLLVSLINAIDTFEGGPRDPSLRNRLAGEVKSRDALNVSNAAHELSSGGAVRFDPEFVAAQASFFGREWQAVGEGGNEPRQEFLRQQLRYRDSHVGGGLSTEARRALLRLSESDRQKLDLLRRVMTEGKEKSKERTLFHALLASASHEAIEQYFTTYGTEVASYQSQQVFDPVKEREHLVNFLVANPRGMDPQNKDHLPWVERLQKLVLEEANRELRDAREEILYHGMAPTPPEEMMASGSLGIDGKRESQDRMQRMYEELRQAAAVELLSKSIEGKPSYVSVETKSWFEAQLSDDATNPFRDLKKALENPYHILSDDELLKRRIDFETSVKSLEKEKSSPDGSKVPLADVEEQLNIERYNLKLVEDVQKMRRGETSNPKVAQQISDLRSLLFPGEPTDTVKRMRDGTSVTETAYTRQLANAVSAAEARLKTEAQHALAQLPAADPKRWTDWKKRDGESDVHFRWRQATERWDSFVDIDNIYISPIFRNSLHLPSAPDEKVKDKLWGIWQAVQAARQRAIEQVLDGNVTTLKDNTCLNSQEAAASSAAWANFNRDRDKAFLERNARLAKLSDELGKAIGHRHMLSEKRSVKIAEKTYPRTTREMQTEIDREIGLLSQQIQSSEQSLSLARKNYDDFVGQNKAFLETWERDYRNKREEELRRRSPEIQCLFRSQLQGLRASWVGLNKAQIEAKIKEALKGEPADYESLLGIFDPETMVSRFHDIHGLRSDVISVLAPQLLPPQMRWKDTQAFTDDYLVTDLTHYFDLRERYSGLITAIGAMSPGELPESWMDTALAEETPELQMPNAGILGHITPQETRRILDLEWAKLKETRKEKEKVILELEAIGIKFVAGQLDYSEARLFEAKDLKSLESLLRRSKILFPRPVYSSGETAKDPWDRLMEDLKHQYVENGSKPMFQKGLLTAVVPNPESEEYPFRFLDATEQRRQLAVEARAIQDQFSKIQRALLDLRSANNRFTQWAGLTSDETQRRLFDEYTKGDPSKGIPSLQERIAQLRRFGTLSVDPEHKYYEAMMPDPQNPGQKKYGAKRLPWFENSDKETVAEGTPWSKERFPKDTDKLETPGYLPVYRLADSLQWQLDHHVALDTRRILEKIDADHKAMTREYAIQGTVLVASALLPPLLPKAALLGAALHSARTAVVLHGIGQAYDEVKNNYYAITGELPPFLGDKKTMGEMGHSDTEPDFYKSIGMFMLQSGMAKMAGRALGLGSLAPKGAAFKPLPASASLQARVAHAAKFIWQNRASLFKHYGAHGAVGVGSMHTASMASDTLLNLWREGKLPDGEKMEEFFFAALMSDMFALGMDQQASSILRLLPGGERFIVRYLGALGANYGVHGGITYVELNRQRSQLSEQQERLREQLLKVKDKTVRAELQRNIDELDEQLSELGWLHHMKETAFREFFSLSYFAIQAAKAPPAMLTQKINSQQLGKPPVGAKAGEVYRYQDLVESLNPELTAQMKWVEQRVKEAEEGNGVDKREIALLKQYQSQLKQQLENAPGVFLSQSLSLRELSRIRDRAFTSPVDLSHLREPTEGGSSAGSGPAKTQNASEIIQRENRLAFEAVARNLGMTPELLNNAMKRVEATANARNRGLRLGQSAAGDNDASNGGVRNWLGMGQPTENGTLVRNAEIDGPVAQALPEVLHEALSLKRQEYQNKDGEQKDKTTILLEIAKLENKMWEMDLYNPQRHARFEIPGAEVLPHSLSHLVTPSIEVRKPFRPTWHKTAKLSDLYSQSSPSLVELRKLATLQSASEERLDYERLQKFVDNYTPDRAIQNESWQFVIEQYKESEGNPSEKVLELVRKRRLRQEVVKELYGDEIASEVARKMEAWSQRN